MRALQLTVDAVQRNCDVADARYAREAPLCTYLLAMREQYRWEHDLPLTTAPPRVELGHWVAAREAHWDGLESSDFAPVPVGDRRYPPFDATSINCALRPHGLVYGAGHGRLGRPHFFLGRLARAEQRDGLTVLVSGREYARDVVPLLGALQGDTAYVRGDALRRVLWERIELWEARGHGGALRAALESFGYFGDREAAFERMVGAAVETVILHELGERAASGALGPGWEAMLGALRGVRAEALARAVRDNLADCLSTMPVLADRRDTGPLQLYFALFEGLRRELFPRLVAVQRAAEGPAALRTAAEAGARHWTRIGRLVLDTFGSAADGEAALERLLAAERPSLAL
jgi:hypothetical protein